jgi:hypothetical protein
VQPRRRDDPVDGGVDLLHGPVLAARRPEVAARELEQRGGDGQWEAVLHPAGVRVDADDLGAAREPQRAGARGDPAGIR